MEKWWKKRKRKKVLSGMLKSMIKPILLPLVGVLDTMIKLWQMALVERLKTVDPDKFIDTLCDGIDDLRGKIKDQIVKVLGE